MEHPNDVIPDFLLQLIEGSSTYFKISIKFWIAIAIFSIIIIIPNEIEKLPYDLGEIKKVDFYPYAYLIISLLIICFGSSLSQAFRTDKLIYRAIEDLIKEENTSSDKKKLRTKYVFAGNIYIEDILDSLKYPSLNRVAPLAQLLYGKNQFLPESKKVTKRIRVICAIYYLILKTISIVAMFIFPGYALIKSYNESHFLRWDFLSISFLIIGLISLIILFQLAVSVTIHMFKSAKRIIYADQRSL